MTNKRYAGAIIFVALLATPTIARTEKCWHITDYFTKMYDSCMRSSVNNNNRLGFDVEDLAPTCFKITKDFIAKGYYYDRPFCGDLKKGDRR